MLTSFPIRRARLLHRPPAGGLDGRRRAEEWIRANIDRSFAVAEVAEAAGTSLRSLQVGLSRQTKTTLTKMIETVRLERFRSVLIDPPRGSTGHRNRRSRRARPSGQARAAYRRQYSAKHHRKRCAASVDAGMFRLAGGTPLREIYQRRSFRWCAGCKAVAFHSGVDDIFPTGRYCFLARQPKAGACRPAEGRALWEVTLTMKRYFPIALAVAAIGLTGHAMAAERDMSTLTCKEVAAMPAAKPMASRCG